MIANILKNKTLNPVVTELFIRGRKLSISLVFTTQSYFAVSKNIRLNSTFYFIIKVPNKQELQQVAFNHSSDINIKNFMNLIKNVLQNHILSYSFMLLLYQKILHVSERIFSKK